MIIILNYKTIYMENTYCKERWTTIIFVKQLHKEDGWIITKIYY